MPYGISCEPDCIQISWNILYKVQNNSFSCINALAFKNCLIMNVLVKRTSGRQRQATNENRLRGERLPEQLRPLLSQV
jgi:hypothetical protein